MLSYQHMYHAGSLADIHKHSYLCVVIEDLLRKSRALTYMETHAGRGLYDLSSAEADKTGEAVQGWIAVAQDQGRLAALPERYVGIVRGLNDGALTPLYPGSPLLAAKLLRPQDRMQLMELHPQEYAALEKLFAGDARVSVHRLDGYEGVMAHSPPIPRKGLVLIDPSYEIKTEYAHAAAFVERLRRRWADATILVWYPLLPAGLHLPMLDVLAKADGAALYHEFIWAQPGEKTGMYGSGLVGLNLPLVPAGFRPLTTGSQ